MSIKKAKDQAAKELGYHDFNYLKSECEHSSAYEADLYKCIDRAMEIYAEEFLQQNAKRRQTLNFDNFSCVGIPYEEDALTLLKAYASQQRTEMDERINYYEDKIEMLIRTSAQNEAHAREEGIKEGFEAARTAYDEGRYAYSDVDDYLRNKPI